MSARRALIGNAALMLFRDVLQFGAMIVMTRLLTPDHYGRFAMVSATITFLAIFSARPMLEYVPIAQEKLDLRSYFWTCGLLQLVPIAALCVLSVLHTPYASDPAMRPLLYTAFVFFVVDWFASFHQAVLQRELRWGRVQWLQGAGLAVGLASGLYLAISGYGALALVCQVPIAISAVAMDGLVSLGSGWRDMRPAPPARMIAACRPALRHGFFRTVSGVLSGSRPLLESLMMVSAAGYSLLGEVNRAISLPNQLLGRVPTVLSGILQPFLAAREAQGMPVLRRANRLILSATAWLLLPVAVLFFELGIWIANLLYGRNWIAVGPLVRAAALFCLTNAVLQVGIGMLNARRRSHVSALIDGIGFAGIAVGLYFLESGGAAAYLFWITLFQALALVLMFQRLVSEELLLFRDVWEIVVLPGLFLVTVVALLALPSPPIPFPWPGIFRASTAFLAFYAYLRLAATERFRDLAEASGLRSRLRWLTP